MEFQKYRLKSLILNNFGKMEFKVHYDLFIQKLMAKIAKKKKGIESQKAGEEAPSSV